MSDPTKRKKGESRDDFLCRREQENWGAMPHLTCCEASRTHPVVMFHLERGAAEPKWTANIWDSLVKPLIARLGSAWYRNQPEVKFCPYCGVAVPTIQKKAEPPEPLQAVSEDYCLACKDRVSRCICWPAESAYEPVPPTKLP